MKNSPFDFENYTIDELKEALGTIDRAAHPGRTTALQAEYAKRMADIRATQEAQELEHHTKLVEMRATRVRRGIGLAIDHTVVSILWNTLIGLVPFPVKSTSP